MRMKRSAYLRMTTFQSVLVISAGENGDSRGLHVFGAASPHVMFIMGRIEELELRNAFDHDAFDEPNFIGCSASICPHSVAGTICPSFTLLENDSEIDCDFDRELNLIKQCNE
jgi:hypothetical protein